MKLNFNQHILLLFVTLLAFLAAPLLLVWGLVWPIIGYVIGEVWSALNFPHDVRQEVLWRWFPETRPTNVEGELLREIQSTIEKHQNSGGNENGRNN